MKPKLLYLVHRIPYPPNKGDKIRSFNMLKFLAEHFDIYLAAFIDADEDWQYIDELQAYCVDTCFAPLPALRAKVRSLTGLLSNTPLTLPYYADAGLRAWINVRRAEVDRVLVFSSAMAQYVASERWRKKLRVIDFVDVDSDKWSQYAQSKTWPMNWVYRREARTLLKFESEIAREFDASLFVSAKEAELFRQLSHLGEDKVTHMNNGVDVDHFSPAHALPSPFNTEQQNIVFTGAMDYWANEDAVIWFAESVLPMVLVQCPAARFFIVGSRPGRKVQALVKLPQVEVTGSVEDVRPYIQHADVVVAPMRIARGIQNKVLEGMAMARPVVVTSQGFDGIEADMAHELVVRDGADAFAAAVIDVLQGRAVAEMGQRARQRVVEDYSWSSSLSKLLPLLQSA